MERLLQELHGMVLSCQLVSQPVVAPLAALDVEYLDVLVQLGLPSLHHRLLIHVFPAGIPLFWSPNGSNQQNI